MNRARAILALTGSVVLGSALVAGAALQDPASPASRAAAAPSWVLVDTDAALDDLRALALLIAHPRIRLLGVVTSDGVASPADGVGRVREVLECLGGIGIPIAAGEVLGKPAPPWRDLLVSVPACPERLDLHRDHGSALGAEHRPAPAAVDLLDSLLASTADRVVYICLGPLTNLASLLAAHPERAEDIARICYQGRPPGQAPESWNTGRDVEAAAKVLAARLPLLAVTLAEDQYLTVDSAMVAALEEIVSPSATLIARLHREHRVRDRSAAGHYRCWDETVVLCLDDSDWAASVPDPDFPWVRTIGAWDKDAARAEYLHLLSGATAMTHDETGSVLFSPFPSDPQWLREDIRDAYAGIFERHGSAEWKAGVLASEIHGHLGIYSLIGVKMGLRARELLCAQAHDLEVLSLAGREPPLSCLTDGLQVATGATLGRGTISVQEGEHIPAAVFIKGPERLRLTLIPALGERIAEEIAELERRHPGLGAGYWPAVERLALRYWLELDRAAIFEEKKE